MPGNKKRKHNKITDGNITTATDTSSTTTHQQSVTINPQTALTQLSSKTASHETISDTIVLSDRRTLELFRMATGRAFRLLLDQHQLHRSKIITRFDAIALIDQIYRPRDSNKRSNSAFSFHGMKINFHHMGLYQVLSEKSYPTLVSTINGVIVGEKNEVFLRLLASSSKNVAAEYAKDLKNEKASATELVKLYNLESARRLSAGTFNYMNILYYLYNGEIDSEVNIVRKVLLEENVMKPKGSSSKSDSKDVNPAKLKKLIIAKTIVDKLTSNDDTDMQYPPALKKAVEALKQFKEDIKGNNKDKFDGLNNTIAEWNKKQKKAIKLDNGNVSRKISKRIAADKQLATALENIQSLDSFKALVNAFDGLMEYRYGQKDYETKLLSNRKEITQSITLAKGRDNMIDDDDQNTNSDASDNDNDDDENNNVDVNDEANNIDANELLVQWLINKAASKGHRACLNREINLINKEIADSSNQLISLFNILNTGNDTTAKRFVATLRMVTEISQQYPILKDVSINLENVSRFLLQGVGKYQGKGKDTVSKFNNQFRGVRVRESVAHFKNNTNPNQGDSFFRVWKLTSIIEIARNPLIGGFYLAAIFDGLDKNNKV